MALWTSERIRKLREKHLLTQTELGEYCSVSKITVYLWEKGDRHPSFDHQALLEKLNKTEPRHSRINFTFPDEARYKRYWIDPVEEDEKEPEPVLEDIPPGPAS